LRDPSIPLTDPVAGLSEYARSAGWAAPLAPPLDQSALGFAHDMLMKLHGVSWQGDPNIEPGGGPNRYADTFTGEVDGRKFVVSNVSFTWSFFHGGEHPVAGALCGMTLGFLLPLVFVSPRHREPHMRAMTKPVRLGRADFDDRFEVRSGHEEYAVALIGPMADEMMLRDDWAFVLEFGSLISLAAVPFESVDEVKERLRVMSTLVSLIPDSVRRTYEVKVMGQEAEPVELSPEDQQRARQLMQAMPEDQRRALMARMRSEGPEPVVRELLDGDG
jgi:hypothetical protein